MDRDFPFEDEDIFKKSGITYMAKYLQGLGYHLRLDATGVVSLQEY